MAEQKTREVVTTRTTPAAADRMMQLAPNLELDVDSIIGEGIIGFGIKGSGKTNAGAVFAEQFGKFHVPMAVFDMEGDYLSLVEVLPRGYVATADNFPTGTDILEQGIQVIYDLSTWESDELAAELMVAVVSQLMRHASAQSPQERVPCMIFLDEAAYWLPQGKNDAINEVTRQSLLDTFHQLAARGRKRGLIPCLFTQRISEIHKKVISQAGVRVFMRATQDNDLDRYLSYLQRGDLTPQEIKARIAAFKTGQAIITLPGGAQRTVRFHQRQSEHISHTPKVQAALNKYAHMPFNAAMRFEAHTADSALSEPKLALVAAQLPTKTQQIKQLLQEDPTITTTELAGRVGCHRSLVLQVRQSLSYK